VCVAHGKTLLSELGIKERRIGSVTILRTDAMLRIKLRFGGSSVPLADAAAALMASGRKHILVSLDGVNSISAKNMGELVATYVAVKNGGGQFKLFNLRPMVRQLMQATNLFAVFQLHENEANALKSFPAEVTQATGDEISQELKQDDRL
jgi:anti-sigma B factor antagonist